MLDGEQQQHDQHGDDAAPLVRVPMPLRPIIRQIPHSIEYMGETLHLVREIHAHQLWLTELLYNWGL